MIRSYIAGYPILLPPHRSRFHLEHPEWHKAWLDSIHESLKPDDVVIDVGAEQGDLSALVASWVPDGGVIVVEPVSGFWPTIRGTFEANGLEPWGCIPAFASDSMGNWGSNDHPGWPKGSYGEPNEDPGFQHLNERADLPAFTVDAFVERSGIEPSALTIDVEGAEFKALRGAEGFLTESHPLVWCAIHPESMMLRYGHDANELLAFMYRMGYRWDLLGFASEIHVKFSPR